MLEVDPRAMPSAHRYAAEFLTRAIAKYADRFQYDRVAYRNQTTRVELMCRQHGSFHATPKAHLYTQAGGCPGCIKKLRRTRLQRQSRPQTAEAFIAKARAVHGDAYCYDAVDYVNSKTKVTILCPTHGPYHKAPDKHLGGQGCKRCSWERLGRRRRMSVWEVIGRILLAHGNIDGFEYNLRGFTNRHSKITIRCPKHGDFRQSIDAHINGHGCPKCCSSKGERKVRQTLKALGVEFKEQVRFPECRAKRALPFDFYVPSQKLLIEYDGQQHYSWSERWGGRKQLERTRRHDAIRNEFAARHGFRLLRIPYWEYDTIDTILERNVKHHSAA